MAGKDEVRGMAERFEASFDKGVNKTAFLFFDWAATRRFPSNGRRMGMFRDWMLAAFRRDCRAYGCRATWRNAVRWHALNRKRLEGAPV